MTWIRRNLGSKIRAHSPTRTLDPERGPAGLCSAGQAVLDPQDVPPGGCTRPGSQVLCLRYPHAVVMGSSETAVSSFILFPGAALLWLRARGPGRGHRMGIFVDGAGHSGFRSAYMYPRRWRYRPNTQVETGLAQGCCVPRPPPAITSVELSGGIPPADLALLGT